MQNIIRTNSELERALQQAQELLQRHKNTSPTSLLVPPEVQTAVLTDYANALDRASDRTVSIAYDINTGLSKRSLAGEFEKLTQGLRLLSKSPRKGGGPPAVNTVLGIGPENYPTFETSVGFHIKGSVFRANCALLAKTTAARRALDTHMFGILQNIHKQHGIPCELLWLVDMSSSELNTSLFDAVHFTGSTQGGAQLEGSVKHPEHSIIQAGIPNISLIWPGRELEAGHADGAKSRERGGRSCTHTAFRFLVHGASEARYRTGFEQGVLNEAAVESFIQGPGVYRIGHALFELLGNWAEHLETELPEGIEAANILNSPFLLTATAEQFESFGNYEEPFGGGGILVKGVSTGEEVFRLLARLKIISKTGSMNFPESYKNEAEALMRKYWDVAGRYIVNGPGSGTPFPEWYFNEDGIPRTLFRHGNARTRAITPSCPSAFMPQELHPARDKGCILRP